MKAFTVLFTSSSALRTAPGILNLVNGDRTLIAFVVGLATIVFPLTEMLALIYLQL